MESPSLSSDSVELKLLFGYMPMSEANGVFMGELAMNLDIAQWRSRWLDKTTTASALSCQDSIVDDLNLQETEMDFDPSLRDRILAVRAKLDRLPYWKATPYTIKLVEIDKLIALQGSVNLNRVERIRRRIPSNASLGDLIDLCFDFNRPPTPVYCNLVAPNAYAFSTVDEDVRFPQPEIRLLPRHQTSENLPSWESLPSLVVQAVPGDPFVYVVKTHAPAGLFPSIPITGTRHFFVLQNGFHRAYALREAGFTHIPCIVVEPVTGTETGFLQTNWSPERQQQIMLPRPPLMKDFFNPGLIETVRTRTKETVWKVSWNIEKLHFQAP